MVRFQASKAFAIVTVMLGGITAASADPPNNNNKKTTTSAPAKPAPALPAPQQRTAPNQMGGFGGSRPSIGGGNTVGGGHPINSIAPPAPGGGAHAIGSTASPSPVAHNVSRPEPPPERPRQEVRGGPAAGNEAAGRKAESPREAAQERHQEPGPAKQAEARSHMGANHEVPVRHAVFTPAAKVAVAAAAGAAATAVAAHHLAAHREEFAKKFGPGHDAVRDREFVEAHAHDFHDRNFSNFTESERVKWQGGVWNEDWHYGRWGWWYDVDDVWYPYPEPVYPYPLTVAEIVVPDGTVIETPAGVVAADPDDPAAPPVAAPVSVMVASPAGAEVIVRPLPPAPIVGYQCTPLAGSYPAVRLCPASWVIVPE